MPLPPGTFTGEDLTTMELRVFDQLLKKEAAKRAAWDLSKLRSRKDGEGLVTGEGEGVKVGDSGAQNDARTTEVDASAASTIVAPTPGIDQGGDGNGDDGFQDALEDLEVHGEYQHISVTALAY